MERKIKLLIEFDGSSYHGWQFQDNGLTVQEVLEKCICRIVKKQTTVHGSSRTDAGVHAIQQSAHFDTKSKIQEIDIIRSLFPGGSITGAPKEKSMQIIDSLENYSRGIYTGSIGSIFSNGDMDFNIAIRTMTIDGCTGQYPVGGGIVWESSSIDEWNEAQLKSKILSSFEF